MSGIKEALETHTVVFVFPLFLSLSLSLRLPFFLFPPLFFLIVFCRLYITTKQNTKKKELLFFFSGREFALSRQRTLTYLAKSKEPPYTIISLFFVLYFIYLVVFFFFVFRGLLHNASLHYYYCYCSCFPLFFFFLPSLSLPRPDMSLYGARENGADEMLMPGMNGMSGNYLNESNCQRFWNRLMTCVRESQELDVLYDCRSRMIDMRECVVRHKQATWVMRETMATLRHEDEFRKWVRDYDEEMGHPPLLEAVATIRRKVDEAGGVDVLNPSVFKDPELYIPRKKSA